MAKRQGTEAVEMLSSKRLCSTVVSKAVRRIAVEGNIATGKSTFLRVLRESSPDYHVISEPLMAWQNVDSGEVPSSQQCRGNLLDLFYKDPKRWAYTFQAYACLSRLKAQLRAAPPEVSEQTNPVIFFERSVYSDKFVFAENCHEGGFLSEVEWNVYCDWHSFLLTELPLTFDGFIYLRTTPQISWDRMQKRGRPEERDVSLDYLQCLHDKHEKWLIEKSVQMPDRQSNVPILVLDCDHEFENDRDQAKRLLDQVSKFIASL